MAAAVFRLPADAMPVCSAIRVAALMLTYAEMRGSTAQWRRYE